jgi:N-methylhydantoinase A
MRYVGQAYELEIPFPEGKGEITREIIEDVVKRFHKTHQSVYQHSAPDTPSEFMAFRMVYSQTPMSLPTLAKATSGPEAVPKMWRQAYFDEYKGFVNTPIYERTALVRGQKLTGPAILEQADTTTVVYPNQAAEVDSWGNLILRDRRRENKIRL